VGTTQAANVSSLRSASSDALGPRLQRELRAMLDAAYAGDFSSDDWRHALGGTHVWIENDGRVVAHAAVVRRRLECTGRRLSVGYVEAVATAVPYRRQGLATRVMQHVGALIAEQFDLGLLSTGESGFYARLGWEPWTGPSFVDAPGGRVATPDDDGGLMMLRTPRTPALDPGGAIVADWRSGDVW
jgi:aminoglycoside 2'-N-acetyltransferase I